MTTSQGSEHELSIQSTRKIVLLFPVPQSYVADRRYLIESANQSKPQHILQTRQRLCKDCDTYKCLFYHYPVFYLTLNHPSLISRTNQTSRLGITAQETQSKDPALQHYWQYPTPSVPSLYSSPSTGRPHSPRQLDKHFQTINTLSSININLKLRKAQAS